MRPKRWPIAVMGMIAVAVVVLLSPWEADQRASSGVAAPTYGDSFWSHWGDGRAELAGYDLYYPRYGELRRGSAVSIFVTETFSGSRRVKNETRGSDDADLFPVLKLNLMQDFPTGIYDYHLMTSTFVALEPALGRPAGSTTKVVFSAQEWCGQVYSRLVFDANAVHHVSHSYFDGEAEREERLDYPTDSLAADALLIWARGLAAPLLEPGESREVRLLRSLEQARLAHLDLGWQRARVERSGETTRLTVPAGEFEVDRLRVEVPAQRATRQYPPGAGARELPVQRWDFWVERAAPRRIVKWEDSAGLRAELLAVERMPYWSMSGPGYEKALEKLRLRPRPEHTP